MACESQVKKYIILIDEIDSLCGSRSKSESDSTRSIKTEFLVQMDGVGKKCKDVLVVAATNIPWELDMAIRRRFKKRVYIPLPELEARSYMVKLHLGDTPNSLINEDYFILGKRTEGASGSDIKVLVKEALMQPISTCQKAKHFFHDHNILTPCLQYPNCVHCPKKLSLDKSIESCTCQYCGAIRMKLWDVPPEKLKVPDVSMEDFENVLTLSFASVSGEELEKYIEWTEKNGA